MSVTRAFDIHFAFGHRLLGYEGKCRYLHGHNGLLRIVLALPGPEAAPPLDLDAARAAARAWVEERLDHQVLLSRDDPLAAVLAGAGQRVCSLETNPSAENIARLVHGGLRALGLPVTRVDFWETPASSSSFGS